MFISSKAAKSLYCIVFSLTASICFCENSDVLFYKELNLIGGYSHRDQWTGKRGKTLKNALGFEYFQTFSNEYGDFLKLDFQLRTSYDSIADSGDRWAVEIHNAWGEYKLGMGKFLRFGHFDPAFGLEPQLDTHGTLLQTLALKNIGYKKDWGIGYSGLLGGLDLEIAAQTGSGMGLQRRDNSFLLTTRISSPQTEQFKWGLSLLYGRTLQAKQARTIPEPDLLNRGKATQKSRIGLDIQTTIGTFDFKAEAAVGDNEGDTAGGAMAELGYTFENNPNLRAKFQTLWWVDKWKSKEKTDLTVSPVLEYKWTNKITLRAGYFHDLYAMNNQKRERAILLQLYYFGD